MAVQISGNDITVPRDGSFTRNVTIGGTLTYEDVTNIDSVGLVTARQGIEVGSGVGVAASISVDGNAEFAGIVTATTFKGDGSQLSNVTSTTINNNADNRIITGSGTANTLEGESTLTFSNSGSAGQINLKRSTSSNQEAIFAYGSSNLEIETRESTGIKLKTNQSDRVSIAASDGFMTNVNPVFCIKPTSGSQSSPNGVNTKIQFAEHVITERGSGVDFTNNRYVAPIGGYYHFAYTIYTYYASLSYIDVKKNGTLHTRNWGTNVNHQANPLSVSGALTLLLVKGDYIELFSQVSSSSDGYVFSNSNNATIFMGHLIG